MPHVPTYRLAWVDLMRRTVEFREVEGPVVSNFVGGKGLAAHVLYRHMAAGIDPLGPENLIALLTGPLTGTAFPASSRSVMAFKSPATGTFSDSYCGGRLGPYLRRGGIEGLVIEGRASAPVYLLVDQGAVTIESADRLWGSTTSRTAGVLKNELGGGRMSVAAIGPAGENLIPVASVMNGTRAYGRGGAGAVWGAKNLKAVVVRDGEGVILQDGERFRRLVNDIRKRLKENPLTRHGGPWNTYGTMMTVGVTQETGTLPALNWQENAFDRAPAVQADAFKPYLTGTTACFGCPIACGRTARLRIDGKDTATAGPEYESIYAFGPNCGVDDPRVLVAANALCSDYGLDTISTGVIVGFAMECNQRGRLPGVPAIAFGDGRGVLDAIPSIALGSRGWELLAQGVKKASAAIPGSAGWAMHVKGLELPGYDPRGMKGQALCYALADRGGCHLRSSTLGPELLGVPRGYERLSYEGKAELIARMQLDKILFNTLPLCLFAGSEIHLEDGARAASAVLGMEMSVDGLLEIARRTRTLIRLFNVREGFGRADDTLPDRLFDEPSTQGPSAGETVDRSAFENLLTAYYDQVGWSSESGVPTPETMDRLGL